MSREINVEVYQDTMRLCKANKDLKDSITTSIKGQRLLLECDAIDAQIKQRYDNDAKVVVSQKRTYEAAMDYKDEKVCVLNFASATTPGGGVTKGSSAQEEALCRCSTLYPCLNIKEMWNGFYYPHRNAKNPIHNDDCIYTPDVVVFKSDTDRPKLLRMEDWKKVDVITCAAPNLRPKPSNRMNGGEGEVAVKVSNRELQKIHEKKLRRILDIALANNVEVMILGAFGCGAFQNSPLVVATAMHNVIKDYLREFKAIEFAVYCGPRDQTNYTEFKRVMHDLTK